MRNAAWIVVGMIATAGLGYASYWVYLEVQQQIRGTLISGFGIFAGVMGAFALLGVAHVVSTLSRASAMQAQDALGRRRGRVTFDKAPRMPRAAAEGTSR